MHIPGPEESTEQEVVKGLKGVNRASWVRTFKRKTTNSGTNPVKKQSDDGWLNVWCPVAFGWCKTLSQAAREKQRKSRWKLAKLELQ